jgi:hypothetical protein
VNVEGGLVAGPVDVAAFGVVLRHRAFYEARAGAYAPVGHEVVEDEAADFAGEVDDGVRDDSGGVDELVASAIAVRRIW